jgi:hypothetical protein
LFRTTPEPVELVMPKVVSLLLKVRLLPTPELTVAVAPPVVMAPPGLTLTTVVPPNVVLSVPAVAGVAVSQVTLPVPSPAQAASALPGWPAITAMNAPVKAVLASHARRLGGRTSENDRA